MIQLLDQTNLATGGLEKGDMALVIRPSLDFDLISTHEVDAPGSPIAMEQHVAAPASIEASKSRIGAGDAGVILKWAGGFQVFMVSDGSTQPVDDTRLYQSLALMNAALALREDTIMEQLLKAADDAGLPRHEAAPGLTRRQREQRAALRGLQIMLLNDDLFEALSDITTDEEQNVT